MLFTSYNYELCLTASANEAKLYYNEKYKNIWRRKATVDRHRVIDINFSRLEFTKKQENEGLIIEQLLP